MARRYIPVQALYIGKFIQERMAEQDISPKHLSEQIGKSVSMISRYLSGEYAIPAEVFLEILDFLDITQEEERQQLIALNRDARDFGWVEGFGSYVGKNANSAKLEGDAEAIREFELSVMPGILQTEEFATALMSAGPKRDDPVAVKRQVEVRMTRAKVLSKDEAPSAQFLLHESILRQRVGGDGVTARQFEHLLNLSKRPNVEIRVLPEETWSHIAEGIVTGFTLYHLPSPLPVVVYIDNSTGAMYSQDPDIDLFKKAFDALWAGEALTPEASLARIAQELKDVTK
ncbi:helix-turn-helix transcriptional regulator [Glycomyces sp. NPDC048151]|uniref:helix-turn-helix domain-containing protein n=1 Tax=Glycomyces sp. NPDC048151 TaxID=3364002 RepID=UPI00371454E0